MANQTNIIGAKYYDRPVYRDIFDADSNTSKLRIYIKSALKVYEAVTCGEVRIDREEFCAAKCTFTVLKDGIISFNQGDAVSVKYDGEGIFYGFVFSKKRGKEGIISVTAYDQMRYLKNRRTYTRAAMRLDEIVSKIASDNALRIGSVERSGVILPAMAAESVSLLDVIRRAAKDTQSLGGGRFILYDDCGYLKLAKEQSLETDILINPSLAENFIYTDSIDKDVYNYAEVYSDKKRYNLRSLYTASDGENMAKWGTLIISKKASDPLNMASEAKALLDEYNRVNREIVIKSVKGRSALRGGSTVSVSLTMGDLYLNGKMRVTRAIHRFENNTYLTDIYIDGRGVK